MLQGIQAAEERFGRLDILVNHAGVVRVATQRRGDRRRLAGFEYLLAAAAGELALAPGSFCALGLALAGLFAAAALIHAPSPVRTPTPVTQQATA